MVYESLCGGKDTSGFRDGDDVVALVVKDLLDLHGYLPETGTIIAWQSGPAWAGTPPSRAAIPWLV
jgi:hypothetical protein